ncbi:uncharacterized protein LOC124190356 [Daphnia pulex]|uniref:uncharacterized protein LOC124190356 n=1 Tax=Daphnia pulex TaxID=6669 RepID=UPI001EDF2E09|nr:uncharacterized protein LOC124190356 [Daphnia pulex]
MISKILVCILVPFVVLSIMFDPADAQAWKDGDGGKIKWQFDCDFPGNDIGNQRVPGDQCGGLCINTNGCNHFSHFNGICYLKKASSIPPRKQTSGGGGVCGFLTGGVNPGNRNVKGTFWAEQSDAGGCQMPQGDYAVTDAIALGQSQALGNLKWRQGLCGQVLRIDCGNGPIDAVVASTCNLNSDSCGVDMIGKTWRRATSNKPPGIVDCSVSLTNRNPLNGNDAICYYRPNSETTNNYSVILGVVNTGGRISSSAVAAGVTGRRNNDGWFEFNGSGSPLFQSNTEVVFRYEDGSSSSFRIGNCRNGGQVQIFR